MRTEMSQVRRETSAYLSSVDKGKEITAITQRKSRQGVQVSRPLMWCVFDPLLPLQTLSGQQRHYKQRIVSEGASVSASGLSDSLLSKVRPPLCAVYSVHCVCVCHCRCSAASNYSIRTHASI